MDSILVPISFYLGFSLMVQITPKSEFSLVLCQASSHVRLRMLMTCLKFLAECSCPHCLILKLKTPYLGMKSDMQDQVKLKRVDNKDLHHNIDLVQEWLFVDGTNISSVAIDRILQLKSLVPTQVGLFVGFY